MHWRSTTESSTAAVTPTRMISTWGATTDGLGAPDPRRATRGDRGAHPGVWHGDRGGAGGRQAERQLDQRHGDGGGERGTPPAGRGHHRPRHAGSGDALLRRERE